MNNPDIYSWIESEESKFETEEIQVGENWFWNFRKHVQMIFHLKNGVFFTGENNWLRAFLNKMESVLDLCYWTEDLEVKDTTFYLDGEDDRAISFLVKKYHDEVYTREHNLDEMYDEITETDLDYGGVLVQKGAKRPEVLIFNDVAFCDQTDILGGPVSFVKYFTPDKLRSMSKFGWGEEKNGADIGLNDLCTMATQQKELVGNLSEKTNNVPGKSIKVNIIRGSMPEDYLDDNGDFEYHCNQLQIRAFYTNTDNKKIGVCLYRKKEEEGNLKFFTFKKIPNRALGRGMGERLLGPQIWTNFLYIHKMNLVEAAGKVPLVTDDETFTAKNKIQDMENLEVTTIQEGRKIGPIGTAFPANFQIFENSLNELDAHIQTVGQAYNSLMGKEESSGTTFKGQERLVTQGRGPHDRRRGQRAKFIEEIYRDWIIPDMLKEITKGKKFMANLSTEELMWVAEKVSTNLSNERIKNIVMNMKAEDVTPERIMSLKQMRDVLKTEILKGGGKKLLELVKDEIGDKKILMGINIAGKQKNLAGISDRILSVFQFALANPIPPHLVKPFNDILEYGGLSPVDFAALQSQVQPMLSPIQPQQAPQLNNAPMA